jgi:4-aminobutyrate aminotransferase-like enzyme
LVHDQHLVERVNQLADLLHEQTLAWRFPSVAAVRKVGALFVLKMQRAELAQRLVDEALQRGLLLRRADSDPACVPLLYALMVPEEQFYEGLDVLEFVLGTLA